MICAAAAIVSEGWLLKVADHRSGLENTFREVGFTKALRLVVPACEIVDGKAYFNYYKVLGFFNWRSTDIPELDPRVFKKLKEATTR